MSSSPVNSADRLVNGKQMAYCLGGTNLNFMRPEASTVCKGVSLKKII